MDALDLLEVSLREFVDAVKGQIPQIIRDKTLMALDAGNIRPTEMRFQEHCKATLTAINGSDLAAASVRLGMRPMNLLQGSEEQTCRKNNDSV